MNETSKQIRDKCQDFIIELRNPQKNLNDKQIIKILITLSDLFHQRLTLIETGDLTALDRTTF